MKSWYGRGLLSQDDDLADGEGTGDIANSDDQQPGESSQTYNHHAKDLRRRSWTQRASLKALVTWGKLRPLSRKTPWLYVKENPHMDDPDDLEFIKQHGSFRTYVEHARDLQKRSWFKRTWVIQEVLLSKTVIVLAGKTKIDWFVLKTLLGGGSEKNVVSVHTNYQFREKNWENYDARDQSGLLYLSDRGGFFDLMCDTQEYSCEDARDKLFGLLSLFRGEIPVGLEPDYSRALEDVYTNISLFCLCHCGIATTLSAACGVDKRSSLPTWVVDWRVDSAVSPFSDNRLDREDIGAWSAANTCNDGEAGFCGGERAALVQPLPDRGLSIRGLRVERIAKIDRMTVRGIRSHQASLNNWRLDRDTVIWIKRVYRDQYIWWHDEEVLPILNRDQEIGFIPKATELEDVVCVFLGFRVPFILRPTEYAWQLVGECYLPWLMGGEQVNDLDLKEAYKEIAFAPFEDFHIF